MCTNVQKLENSRKELRKSLDEKEFENRILQSSLLKTQQELGYYSDQVRSLHFDSQIILKVQKYMSSPDFRQTRSSKNFSNSQSLKVSTPNTTTSSLSTDNRLKVMEIKMHALQEENRILKDKNRKLKEISANVLGKHINHQDARLGLLSSDLEERDKDIDQLKRKEKELLILKEQEIEQLRNEIDYYQIHRLKQEEQFQKQKVEIEENFSSQLADLERRLKDDLRKERQEGIEREKEIKRWREKFSNTERE